VTRNHHLQDELEALERAVPTAAPPRPASARSRPHWTWAPIAGALVAGVAFGVLGARWLDTVPPLGPTASAGPSSPPVTSLVWSATLFLTPDAEPYAITTVGDRLVVTGSDGDGPAAWTSDDRGATWERSAIQDLNASTEPQRLAQIASHDGRLIALGNNLAAGSGVNLLEKAAYVSDDLGSTWRRSVPSAPGADAISGVPDGFVAVGDVHGFTGPMSGVARRRAGAWFSTDGEHWTQSSEPLPVSDELPDGAWSVAASVSVHSVPGSDALVAAAGYQGHTPAAWLSADGRDWELVEIDGLGAVYEITNGPNGFVAVGGWSWPESVCRAPAWRSGDGRGWDVIRLELDCEPSVEESDALPTGAYVVAAGASGFVAVGEDAITGNGTPIWWVPWSADSAIAHVMDGRLRSIASFGDTFFGIGDCGSESAGCAPMLFVGRPPS
jgi:hypothetical protein